MRTGYGFAVETDSVRPHRYGSEIVGHETRESFFRAVAPPMLRCLYCTGFADDEQHVRGCPKREEISGAEARAGLLRAYAQRDQRTDDGAEL